MRTFIVVSLMAIAMFIVITCSGCATYEVKIGDSSAKLTYILQDKNFKSLTFNPETHQLKVEAFGSETSQIVESAITAALTK